MSEHLLSDGSRLYTQEPSGPQPGDVVTIHAGLPPLWKFWKWPTRWSMWRKSKTPVTVSIVTTETIEMPAKLPLESFDKDAYMAACDRIFSRID